MKKIEKVERILTPLGKVVMWGFSLVLLIIIVQYMANPWTSLSRLNPMAPKFGKHPKDMEQDDGNVTFRFGNEKQPILFEIPVDYLAAMFTSEKSSPNVEFDYETLGVVPHFSKNPKHISVRFHAGQIAYERNEQDFAVLQQHGRMKTISDHMWEIPMYPTAEDTQAFNDMSLNNYYYWRGSDGGYIFYRRPEGDLLLIQCSVLCSVRVNLGDDLYAKISSLDRYEIVNLPRIIKRVQDFASMYRRVGITILRWPNCTYPTAVGRKSASSIL